MCVCVYGGSGCGSDERPSGSNRYHLTSAAGGRGRGRGAVVSPLAARGVRSRDKPLVRRAPAPLGQ